MTVKHLIILFIALSQFINTSAVCKKGDEFHEGKWIEWECTLDEEEDTLTIYRGKKDLDSTVLPLLAMVQAYILDPRNKESFHFYLNHKNKAKKPKYSFMPIGLSRLAKRLMPGKKVKQIIDITNYVSVIKQDIQMEISTDSKVLRADASQQVINDDNCDSDSIEGIIEKLKHHEITGIYVEKESKVFTILQRGGKWINLNRKLEKPEIYVDTKELVKDFLCGNAAKDDEDKDDGDKDDEEKDSKDKYNKKKDPLDMNFYIVHLSPHSKREDRRLLSIETSEGVSQFLPVIRILFITIITLFIVLALHTYAMLF